MKFFKVVFVELNYDNKQKYMDYLEETDYGAFEISQDAIQDIEDDIATLKALSNDEGIENGLSLDDLENFKYIIGTDVYDSLLDGGIDFAIVVANN